MRRRDITNRFKEGLPFVRREHLKGIVGTKYCYAK
jgi:hypothetical protein